MMMMYELVQSSMQRHRAWNGTVSTSTLLCMSARSHISYKTFGNQNSVTSPSPSVMPHACFIDREQRRKLTHYEKTFWYLIFQILFRGLSLRYNKLPVMSDTLYISFKNLYTDRHTHTHPMSWCLCSMVLSISIQSRTHFAKRSVFVQFTQNAKQLMCHLLLIFALFTQQ